MTCKFNNKYGNKKELYGGEWFDSKRELRRFKELEMLQRCGKITELKRQVADELIPTQREKSNTFYKRGENKGQPKPGPVIESSVKYIADFVYNDSSGRTVVEDSKGSRTKDYIIKRKLMLFIHGIKIREV